MTPYLFEKIKKLRSTLNYYGMWVDWGPNGGPVHNCQFLAMDGLTALIVVALTLKVMADRIEIFIMLGKVFLTPSFGPRQETGEFGDYSGNQRLSW